MSSAAPPPPDTAAEELRARVLAGGRVDVPLDGGGRLYVERAVPFLTVYRYGDATPAYDLHAEETAYCTVPAGTDAAALAPVRAVLRAMTERFGTALVLEVWTDERQRGPELRVHAPQRRRPAVAEALRGYLDGMELPYHTLAATLTDEPLDLPPAHAPLFSEDAPSAAELIRLGLAVHAFFLDAETGRPDPVLARALRSQLHRGFRRAYYDFVRLETTADATHFEQLGHREVDALVWEIDRELVEISDAFPFLLLVTATDDEAAYERFRDSGFRTAPRFHYRFLPVDPEPLKRRLFDLRIDEVPDPTLAFVLRDKRDETFHLLDMLEHRGSAQFRYGSLQVFGGVEDDLLAVANALLTVVPAGAPTSVERVDAATFYAACQRELAGWAEQYPDIQPRSRLREDLSGLMVSRGELNVGHNLSVPRDRVEALIAHEIGTHVLTYWNGRAQPLTLLHTGTPGYEDLQEGLAVLSEWFVGGLTASRFRTLAARVVAIDHMLRGHGFVSTFQLLHEGHGIPARSAFFTTARAFRCGGFTKDAVYLRGLVELLDYLGRGGRLEPLFTGKLRLSYVPLVDELTERGILRPPPLLPGYFREDAAAGHPKLNFLHAGATVFDLVPRKKP